MQSDNPMRFFSENVDNWGAVEWFDRAAKAIRSQDKAVIEGGEISVETYRMIAASSLMTLVRDHESTVRAALEAALSAAEPSAQDRERVLAQVASIICEETCGLTSKCKSREAAKALFDKGYLSAPPAPSVAVKALQAIANYRRHSRLDSDENAEAMERIAKDALSAQAQDVADVSPADYMRRHDAAVAAYEANTPSDYRYSALALRKAVDAAFAIAAAPAKQEGGE